LGQLRDALLFRPSVGDRRMTYRGVPGMEVHLYVWPELRGDLLSAGFRFDEVVPLDATTAEVIPRPWLLPGLRAGGWLVFARRPGGREPPAAARKA
jgi:hypothetical protein